MVVYVKNKSYKKGEKDGNSGIGFRYISSCFWMGSIFWRHNGTISDNIWRSMYKKRIGLGMAITGLVCGIIAVTWNVVVIVALIEAARTLRL